jgi:uncharacterized membrane protein YccC
MRQHVASRSLITRFTPEWKSLRKQVLQNRAQLGLSLRVTIAAVSSFMLSDLLRLPLPLWTVLTAVILTQVSFGRSLKATMDYLAGTVGGAVYVGVLAALIPHTSEIALVGLLVIAVAPLALLAAVNPRFSVATFTAVMVLLVPGMAHGGPVESALFRVIEVAVGSATALAVSLLVLPARAHSLAIEAAAQMLELAAQFLPELFAGFMQARDESAMASLQDRVGEAVARLAATAAEAKHEQLSFLDSEPELGPLLRTLLRLRHDLVMIGRAAAVPLPEAFQQRLGSLLTTVATTTADYMRQSGEALAVRRAPPPLGAAEAALDACAGAFAAIRCEDLLPSLSIDKVERIFALGFALEQVRRNFHDLERCVGDVAHRQ